MCSSDLAYKLGTVYQRKTAGRYRQRRRGALNVQHDTLGRIGDRVKSGAQSQAQADVFKPPGARKTYVAPMQARCEKRGKNHNDAARFMNKVFTLPDPGILLYRLAQLGGPLDGLPLSARR